MAVVVLRVQPDDEADALRTALGEARARIDSQGATWLVRIDGDPDVLHATLRGLARRFRCMAVLRL